MKSWMKKVSLSLASLMSFSILSTTVAGAITANDTTEYKTLPFDEVKIGVMSDLHISSAYINKSEKSVWEYTMQKAKKAFDYYKKMQVSAIMITGDLVNYGTEAEYQALDGFLEEVYGSPENAPELIFVMGNHEYVHRDNATGTSLGIYETNAEVWQYHKQYLDRWSSYELYNGLAGGEAIGSPIARVDVEGVQIVSISPDATNYTVTDEGIARLKTVMDEAQAEAEGKPIIAGFHFPTGTDFSGVQLLGYNSGAGHGHNKVNTLLQNYPSAVLFSGHTHRSVLSERAISQDCGFTLVHAGAVHTPDNDKRVSGTSLTYDNLPGGYNVLEPSGLKEIDRTNRSCEGMLLTFGEDSMQIDRVDFLKGTLYEEVEPWIIPYEITSENKTEKFDYVNTVRKEQQDSDALTFAQGSTVSVEEKWGVMKITFPSVQQFRDVEGYKIVVSKTGRRTSLSIG